MKAEELPCPRSAAVIDKGDAPPLLVFRDGSRVETAEDWRRRREELKVILDLEYGGMPPALPPEATTVELISTCDADRKYEPNTAKGFEYRVDVAGGAVPLSFTLTVTFPFIPPAEAPLPVIVNGDGCWAYMNEKAVSGVLSRGFAFAQFNRCVLARDWKGACDRGIYAAFPGEYGALSAWAWGYHRAYDAILRIPGLDPSRVAVTGHSRGGKTVQLAAATDGRIAAVGDNNSGCGGFSMARMISQGGETIADITTNFPFWFSKGFAQWAGREEEMPFDQTFLSALIAPRPLLFAVANDDPWSNHAGVCQTFREVSEVYKFLGAEDKFDIVFREGRHYHRPEDIAYFADFAKARM